MSNLTQERESTSHISDLLICGAVGSLIGASAALLLAPKSGEKLRRDITHAYCDLTDKTQEFADEIKERTSEFISHPEKEGFLLAGAISGALLGGVITYLLTQQNKTSSTFDEWREKLKNTTQSISSMDWIETAKEVLSEINEKIHHHNGSTVKKNREKSENTINTILDWADLGLQVWNKVNNRR